VAKADPNRVKWLPDAGEDDYAAAHAYLALIKPPDNVVKIDPDVVLHCKIA